MALGLSEIDYKSGILDAQDPLHQSGFPLYFNVSYVQKNGACELAVYAVILNYFSRGFLSIPDFYRNYIRSFGLLSSPFHSYDSIIRKHFEDYCIVQVKSKLNTISEWHENNQLKSKTYCSILASHFNTSAVGLNEILDLRMKLTGGTMALIRYRATHDADHAIIAGFDPREKRFFIRDPQIKNLIYEDFLLYHSVEEYILFGPSL